MHDFPLTAPCARPRQAALPAQADLRDPVHQPQDHLPPAVRRKHYLVRTRAPSKPRCGPPRRFRSQRVEPHRVEGRTAGGLGLAQPHQRGGGRTRSAVWDRAEHLLSRRRVVFTQVAHLLLPDRPAAVPDGRHDVRKDDPGHHPRHGLRRGPDARHLSGDVAV